jgi:hypothetical protein
MPGYADFEFDLPEALLVRLIEVLDSVERETLSQEGLADVPDSQGVYQLWLDDELVYIGKTDAQAGLRKRLDRHRQKLQHRHRLEPNRVSFRAVRIYVFTPLELETSLIEHYGGVKQVRWNGSGFGSNDPGRERDTTRYKEGHFDLEFPIDIDRPLELELPGEASAAEVLSSLKGRLPYVFRYQNAGSHSRRPHPDLEGTLVNIPRMEQVTTRSVLQVIVPQLPSRWRATLLPSHVILYKDNKDYPQGAEISRSAR